MGGRDLLCKEMIDLSLLEKARIKALQVQGAIRGLLRLGLCLGYVGLLSDPATEVRGRPTHSALNISSSESQIKIMLCRD